MTRISENGQGASQKGAEIDDYDSKAVVLPNLQINSPQTGSSKNYKGGLRATNESFLSAVPKSVGSSRNTNKQRFFT